MNRLHRDRFRDQKRKAVALWNAMVKLRVDAEGNAPAPLPIQQRTRELLDVCAHWCCFSVPQAVWGAVWADLERETTRKRNLPAWWCWHVARAIVWLLDVDYFLKHARYTPPGPERDAQCLRLKERGGHTDRQIEAITGIAHGALAGALRRARKRQKLRVSPAR